MASARSSGIEVRHRTGCPAHDGGKCRCKPGYRAYLWSAAEGKKIKRTFPTLAAARSWRDDAKSQVRRGQLKADAGPTLREAAEVWLEGAKAGRVRNRSGEAYKPSTLRGYEEAFRLRVLPALGARKLRDITRAELQRFIGTLDGSAQTVRNTINPVRALYAHAVAEGDVAVDPTDGLRLPASRGKREIRVETPAEAAALIEHAPDADRALWAVALYAGLRLGELRALRWRDVDFERGVLRVERAMDRKDGEITPKSHAGRRAVPMPPVLREQLEARLPARAKRGGLVFGRDNGKPFDGPTVSRRAARAWKAAGIAPVTLHQCRHAYAAMMIDAGANAKALSTYMGHADIATTVDRYGYLMRGNEAEAAALFDAYLRNGTNNGTNRTGPQRSQ